MRRSTTAGPAWSGRVSSGLICVALLSTGCATIEDTFAPRPTATPTPAAASPATAGGAITPAEARRVAATYAQAFNRAAARLDGGPLAGIETGPLLSAHQAEFTIRKKAGRPAPPVRALASVTVPREEGDRKWFVAPMATSATTGTPATRRLTVFTWDGTGSWKAVSDTVVDLGKARALRGRVSPRTPGAAVPASAGGLTLAPGQVPRVHAAAATPGPAAAQAALLESSRYTSGLRAAAFAAHTFYRRHKWAGRVRVAPADGPVHALRTGSGGALVWYTLDTSFTYRRGQGGARLPWRGGWGVLSGRPYATTEFTRVERTQFTAYVPAKGAGRIQVVAARSTPVSATGS